MRGEYSPPANRSFAIGFAIVSIIVMAMIALGIEVHREKQTDIRNFNQRCADSGGTLIVMPDETDNRCEIPYGRDK